MPHRIGTPVFRFMDLTVVLRQNARTKEERYFFIMNGSGRSFDLEELVKVRNLINAELYRKGRLKDPYKTREKWREENRKKVRAEALAWYHRNADKAHDYYVKVGKARRKELREVRRRAAQAATVKDIKAIVLTVGGTHEVPKAETEGTLPAN